MSFAYSVAIRLTVANLASQGVRILASDLLGAHGNAVKLESKLKALKMIAVGYGMERAGAGILGFMQKSVDASKEYTRQISLMNAAGVSQRELAQSVGAAWSTSHKVMTSSAADNLATLRELRTVFYGRMNEAYTVLPQVQRASAIMEALTGRKQEGIGFDMTKAIERRSVGNVTAGTLQNNMELMTQSILGMSGTINPRDFHQALQKAKLSSLTLNDDFIYHYLPTLIQISKSGGGGGQQAGTQIATTARAVVQGRMLKSMYPIWTEMGLINPADIVHNAGGSVSLKPGSVKGAGLFRQNPYEWANQVVAPAAAAYAQRHHMTMAQTILSMFSDRNASDLVGALILQSPHFQRDASLIKSVGGSKGAYDILMKTNPQLAEMALHNQWQNVLSILGYQILPRLIPYMIRFANLLDGIAQFMERHPALTSGLAIGGAAAGVGLTVGGKALMTAGIMKYLGIGLPTLNISSWLPGLLTAGRALIGFLPAIGEGFVGLVTTLGGPVTWAIAAVAAAGYLVYRNWATIGPFLAKEWSIIRAVFHVSMAWVVSGARAMWATLAPYLVKGWSILKALGGLVWRTFGSIYNGITGFLGKIVNWIANSPIGKAIGWVGGQIGAGVSAIGNVVGKDFDQAYRWSQDVNRQYEGGGSPYVYGKSGQGIQVTTNLTVDGHKMARVVTMHQARDASRPPRSSGRVDNNRHPLWPSNP